LSAPWWRHPAAVALVAANLVPALGVLLWDWHILPLMLLFWLENLVIGLFAVARILLARGEGNGSGEPVPALLAFAGRLFVAAFFTVHYGFFCAGHGFFILTLFGGDQPGANRVQDLPDVPRFVLDFVLRDGLIWAVLALVASHGVSFFIHYLKPRAYEAAQADELMFEPYKRIVVLHVVIIASGFAAAALGASVAPLLLLIGLKTVVDLGAHRREHGERYVRIDAKRDA
jgi:hypothetical protein